MPWFEIGGQLFETEYGPITEKEVIEAIDDMAAFYILSEGNFDEIRLHNLERIGMASAHETLEHSVRVAMGVGLGISSVVPAPYGAPTRKVVGLLGAGLEYLLGAQVTDAYMRSQVKKEIKRRVDKQIAKQEGRE